MYNRAFDSHILVVDDMPVMTELISMWLCKKGFRHIHCFNDPGQALDFVLKGMPVDLIITDYRMGSMNGVTLLSTVAKSNPGIPAVIVSCAPHDIPTSDKYSILHKNDMLEILPKIIPQKLKSSLTDNDKTNEPRKLNKGIQKSYDIKIVRKIKSVA